MSSQEYNVLNSLFVALDQRVNSMDKRIITVEQRVTTLEQFAKTVTVTQPTTQPPVTTPTSTPTTGTQPVTTTPQAGTTTTTTTTPPATTTTPAAPETYAVCTAFGLNVRSGPGSTYPVVAGLVSGQRVQVLERKNGWARLNTPAGWSSEQYLRFM
jgi:uncharacterized protein YgiM (DUF1202 family)